MSPPTDWTATTSASASTRTSASAKRTATRTSGASRRLRNCSRTATPSPSPHLSRPIARTVSWRASSMRRQFMARGNRNPACHLLRSILMSLLRWRSREIRRVCIRRRGRGLSRSLRGSVHRTRPPRNLRFIFGVMRLGLRRRLRRLLSIWRERAICLKEPCIIRVITLAFFCLYMLFSFHHVFVLDLFSCLIFRDVRYPIYRVGMN
ncbi:adenylyl-sulfate kinase [Histoplasma ohiense]|nr:adenylyl-sulfate kinase [Histoplasma ohiense (nom. inval.)]